MVCVNLRHATKVESIQASSKFEVGQYVEFDGGARQGIVVIEVTGFSRDFSKVKGLQVNRNRGIGYGSKWTASANLYFALSAERTINIKNNNALIAKQTDIKS